MNADNVRKQISCDTPTRRIRLGWISLQRDGSVSFGLNDRTYIAPRFRDHIGIWNAYNRQHIEYVIPSDPSALEPVDNPHFTYHPPGIFQLTSDRTHDVLFRAAVRLDVALGLDGEMPWIRAVSSPLAQLPLGGIRPDKMRVDEIVVLCHDETQSISIAIDLVQQGAFRLTSGNPHWFMPWGDFAVRLALAFVPPQIATLSWFHAY